MDTVLAVADPHPAHHFLVRCGRGLARRGWRLRVVPYARIRDVPIDGVRAAILHFPHSGWAGLEAMPQLYGSPAHGSELSAQLVTAGEILRLRAPGIRFLNSPEAVALTRDKGELKSRLYAAGIPAPRRLFPGTPEQVEAAVERHGCLFVKVPCGSMAKGITVLTPQRRRSTFAFDDGALRAPRPGDPQYVGPDNWEFADVGRSDREFLAALCAAPGMIVELGLAGAAVADRRVEARVTVLDGCVVRATIATATAGEPVTRPQPGSTVPGIGDAVLTRIAGLGRRAAAALDLRYAELDMVLDSNRSPMIIDVQAFPATGTSIPLFDKMIDHLVGARVQEQRPYRTGRTAARPPGYRPGHRTSGRSGS